SVVARYSWPPGSSAGIIGCSNSCGHDTVERGFSAEPGAGGVGRGLHWSSLRFRGTLEAHQVGGLPRSRAGASMTANPTPASKPTREYVGETICQRYRLDGYLSEGNFGAVFKAAHVAYGLDMREVAVKIGKRPMTDRDARMTFGDALEMVKIIE